MSAHSYNVRHLSNLWLSELLTIPDMFPYKKPSLFRSQATNPNLQKSPEMIRCFLALDFTVNSFIHVLQYIEILFCYSLIVYTSQYIPL